MRCFKVLAAIALLTVRAFATLPAAVAWEVRTTGNNNNSGGFVTGATGTDFSQQDAAQYNFTNLASTNGSTNPCIVTSASHNFVATDVGNLLHVTAGTNWLAGFYQIVSVAANAATLDRACGSAASISNGTFFVGGALATISAAMNATGRQPSQKIFVKATATYSQTATLTCNTTVSPTATAPMNRLIGYTSTRTDQGRVTIQLSTNTGLTAIDCFGAGAVTGWSIENFTVDCNSLGTSSGIAIGDSSMVINVKVSNCTTKGVGLTSVNFASLIDSEVTACSAACTAAVVQTGATASFLRNWIHNNSSPGISGTQRVTAMFNLITNNTGASSDGIVLSSGDGSAIFNNTIYASGRHGIFVNSTDLIDSVNIRNNLLVNNSAFGINGGSAAGSAAMPQYDGNAYFNNTSGNRTNMDDTGSTNAINGAAPYTNTLDITSTLTCDPFVNAAGNNFALNTLACGGQAVRQAGTPGPVGGVSTTTGNTPIGVAGPGVLSSGGFCAIHN